MSLLQKLHFRFRWCRVSYESWCNLNFIHFKHLFYIGNLRIDIKANCLYSKIILAIVLVISFTWIVHKNIFTIIVIKTSSICTRNSPGIYNCETIENYTSNEHLLNLIRCKIFFTFIGVFLNCVHDIIAFVWYLSDSMSILVPVGFWHFFHSIFCFWRKTAKHEHR